MNKPLTILCLVLFGCAAPEIQPEVRIVHLEPVNDESFRGLHAVSASVAWLSGTHGTYMRTTDAGKTWRTGSFLDSVDFRDIYAFDAQRAVMISAGAPAVIYKTVDGGDNWTLTYKNDDTRVFFDAIDFWDDLNGMAFSDSFDGRFFMLKTSDGGNSWEQLLSAPEAEEGEGGFAASGTNMVLTNETEIWMGTTTGRVLRSRDRGVSWTSMETPLSDRDSGVAGIFSIAVSGQEALIVGGNYQEYTLAERNSGRYANDTWEATVNAGGFRSAVRYIPETSMAIATGTTGTDLSFDAGRTWTTIDTVGYHAISFGKTKDSGWMSGGSGRIAKIEILE